MGCGASKAALNTVVPTNEDQVIQNTPASHGIRVSKTETEPRSSIPDSLKGTMISRPVIPSIPKGDNVSNKVKSEYKSETLSRKTLKPIAFEISLDDDFFRPRKSQVGDVIINSAGKKALPKLDLTQVELQSKLANTEARWKDLEDQSSPRKRKEMPKLLSSREHVSKKLETPLQLKQRLLEKEAQTAQNRAREREKLQAKLAKQEKHMRLVQERKKALGKLSSDDLARLSWGGELDALAAAAASLDFEKDVSAPVHRASASTVTSRLGMIRGTGAFATKYMTDADSGKGSSAASSFGNSRSGSGRSTQSEMYENNANSNTTVHAISS